MGDMLKLQSKSMILLVVCTFGIGCWALKGMRIHVPEVARSGDTITLSCEYDLEQVPLYSIKWYWNDEEFFRFVPKESPPSRAFVMSQVNVDLTRSGPTDVTLKSVRREQTGDYKCEVSADAPRFHTDIQGAHMIVADLPSDNPVMNIEPVKVRIGKEVRAQCHAPGSNPPANITWFINDRKISSNNCTINISQLEVDTDYDLSLKSSKSTLELITNRSHFIQGLLLIKCQASIYTIWQKDIENNVREEFLQLAPVLGSTSSQSHTDQVIEIISSSCSTHQELGQTMPYFIISIIVFLR